MNGLFGLGEDNHEPMELDDATDNDAVKHATAMPCTDLI